MVQDGGWLMPLEIQHLTHTYGKTRALSDFSWQFHAGFYGVLGPNGAGKTTLMRLISDNIRRQSGRILFQGQDIVGLGRSFREKLGYMPQEQGLYLDMTVCDFLSYIAVLKRIGRQAIRREVDQALHAVDCADQAFTRLSACSGGMRQRIMLAQSLLGQPEILLLDEPTAGLDPYERVRVRQYIRAISRQRIVIWSTHIVSDLEAGADQVLLLRSGSLIDAAPRH
jgi:ABC-type multidrug transport system ATPase subunit